MSKTPLTGWQRIARASDLAPMAVALLVAGWVALSWRRSVTVGVLPAAAACLVAIVLAALWWWHRRRRRGNANLLARAIQARQEGRSVATPSAGPGWPGELAPVARALDRWEAMTAETRGKLEGERDHYREIVAAISDGVLEVDGRGRVRMMTPAFRRFFGVTTEVEGRQVIDLVRRPELAELLTRIPGSEAQIETDLALADGRVVRLSGMPFGRTGALVVARDVTERVRMDETRRDFVANISHELKTPLTAIRGYAETLHEGALREPTVAEKFVGRILGQCQRLEALLADLLALSRLESAGFQDGGNLERIGLRSLCERALEIVSLSAQAKGVTLELSGEEVEPLLGYPEAMERMLLNLLDNAIKYNRRGGWVRVELKRHDGEVVLQVSDGGIGIPERSLDRVFERFYRVDKGRARDEGGTGLGLALVKHAAALHGGRVEVSSRLGQGSSFRVRLPLARG